MSEKARLFLTGLVVVAGLALAGCGTEGLVGPRTLDGGAELSGVAVVPLDGVGELETPGSGRAAAGGGPGVDDNGDNPPDWRDPHLR